jgi:hypothetical protein
MIGYKMSQECPCYLKGVKEYTGKTLSHIPELDPDIEVIKQEAPSSCWGRITQTLSESFP